jgi:branched-chain amino acid transport system permease protein
MKKIMITFIIGLLLGLIFMSQSFLLMIFSTILIFAIAALGLNILSGYTGQVSIGHGAFMAIGAYTTATMSLNFNTPFILNLLLAIIFSAILGAIIALPALRLKGFYLAIATMAFGIAVEQIISSFELFGGHIGLRDIKPLVDSDFYMYLINLAFYAILSYIAGRIINSPNGLKYKMTRDSEIAARSYGVNLSFAKLESFVLSAIYGGIAGSLYAHTIGYIAPTDFALGNSLNLLAMIVIGGMASIHGGLIGSIIITGLPFLFSRGSIPMSIIFGILLIVFVLFFPKGIIYGLMMGYVKYLERPFIYFIKNNLRKNDKPKQKIKVKGKDIYYDVNGEGKSVIMIHGNFGSHKWFNKVNNISGYKIYTVDMPNFGHSDHIENANIDEYADYINEFMNSLNIDKAVIVGHSLGGAVAQSLALRYNNKVNKLILISSAPYYGFKTPEENYSSLALLKNNRSILKESIKGIMPLNKDKKFLNELVNDSLLMNPKCFVENARALEKYDFTDLKDKINFSTMVLFGKKDILITKEMAVRTAEFYNAELKEYDNVGHSLMVEEPELFKKMFINFMNRG